MAFNTALSGLRAANTDLEVTGNNIANASTTGFKKSRAEFGDVYATSLIGGGGGTPGSGVLVSNVAQQFDQGNVSFTDNALDLAINGSGFFVLAEPSGAPAYTRSGYFSLDNNGNIVNNTGSLLQGRVADANGNITGGTPTALVVNTGNLPPSQTDTVSLEFNLDSTASIPSVAAFDELNPLSFNESTSLTVYDSRGESHTMTNFFVKTATNNVWNMHTFIDGTDVVTNGAVTAGPVTNTFYQLSFTSSGILVSPTNPATLTVDNWVPTNGAAGSIASGEPAVTASDFIISVAGSSQFGSDFSVSDVNQDGFAPGRLTSIEIDNTGILFARYSNGEALTLGQIVLASFANEQGLSPLGNTTWGESFESGLPNVGVPLAGSLGAIQAGALEESNVDLSDELVHLIIAQRNFQANAKTIETADTVTQAIINIR
ncbi:MAG: flagellar hook protein FlgE [Pseudomonadales bacterium]